MEDRKMSLRQEIAEIINKEPYPSDGMKWGWSKSLSTEILSAIVKALPEKSNYDGCDCANGECYCGYIAESRNQAIDEMRKILEA